MAPARSQPSAPFVSREFNGEVLLSELASLRSAQVQPHHLADLAVALRNLEGHSPSEAASRLKSLGANRLSATPALANLVVRWATQLKGEADVPLLIAHSERLALTAAILAAVRRGSELLKKGP